jgi:hypothetical protein
MKKTTIYSNRYQRIKSVLLLTCAALMTSGVVASQAQPVIANADFEEQIPGSNRPADWTDVGSKAFGMNNNGGRLNLALPNAPRTISPNTYRGVAQDVDLSGVPTIIFDAGSSTAAPDLVKIVVLVDGQEPTPTRRSTSRDIPAFIP